MSYTKNDGFINAHIFPNCVMVYARVHCIMKLRLYVDNAENLYIHLKLVIDRFSRTGERYNHWIINVIVASN